MENLGDYKVILYIVLAILYFLFSGKKKSAPKVPPPVRQEEERQNQPPIRTLSEERQNQPPVRTQSDYRPQTSNRPSSRPIAKPQAPSEQEPYSLDDILKQFGQELDAKKEEVQETLEVPAMEIPRLEVPKLVDYEASLKDEGELSSILKASEEKLSSKDQIKSKKQNKYAEMLNDPEGIKTAFIASEIFNRKY